jgi:hypothetical protein
MLYFVITIVVVTMSVDDILAEYISDGEQSRVSLLLAVDRAMLIVKTTDELIAVGTFIINECGKIKCRPDRLDMTTVFHDPRYIGGFNTSEIRKLLTTMRTTSTKRAHDRDAIACVLSCNRANLNFAANLFNQIIVRAVLWHHSIDTIDEWIYLLRDYYTPNQILEHFTTFFSDCNSDNELTYVEDLQIEAVISYIKHYRSIVKCPPPKAPYLENSDRL